eukprot:367893-Pleurochrysis_carterae.AAC.2
MAPENQEASWRAIPPSVVGSAQAWTAADRALGLRRGACRPSGAEPVDALWYEVNETPQKSLSLRTWRVFLLCAKQVYAAKQVVQWGR